MTPKPLVPRKPPTHFLCLPLYNASSRQQLVTSINTFRKRAEHVLNNGNKDTQESSRVNESPTTDFGDTAQAEHTVSETTHEDKSRIQDRMFRPPGALHFTLGVMHLEDPEQLGKSIEVLKALDLDGIYAATDIKELESSASQGAPLTTNLTSIHALPSQTNTRVLYTAPPSASPFTTRLQAIAQSLRQPFLAAGLLEEEQRPLLLHATVFNTIYGKAKGRRGKESKRKLQTSQLIEEMQDYSFANDIRLERIAICEMGAKPVEGEEGMRYREVAARALPTSMVGEQAEA